jgi:hypothetical protein
LLISWINWMISSALQSDGMETEWSWMI